MIVHLCHHPVLEAVGRGAADVVGEVGRRREGASQPGQVTVTDQLVPRDPERAQPRCWLEGAAPYRRDVVVLESPVGERVEERSDEEW